MKVFTYKKENLNEEKYLYEALEIDINKKNIICFVGGGGKTTSIYTLGEELSNLGKKVIITTTTHMHMNDDCLIYNGNNDHIINILKYKNLITVGIKGRDNKISSVGSEIAASFIDFCDILLVEADGAKMLPLKAPASHEPVLLNNSTMIVGVAGIDSLYKSIRETCHRPEMVSSILNTNLNHLINPADISNILSSEVGQRKNVNLCDNAEYRAIINKVDNNELLILASEICKNLCNRDIKAIVTTYL